MNFFSPFVPQFQEPKVYKAQICEVHLQNGNSTTKCRLYTFSDLIPVYTATNIFSVLICYLPAEQKHEQEFLFGCSSET